MKPVYFSICRAIVTHPDQWAIAELRIEKSIHYHASFRYVHVYMVYVHVYLNVYIV